MYQQAMSIADIQLHNCVQVSERILAADKVASEIVRLIRESGLSDGLDDLIDSLDMEVSFQSSGHNQGDANHIFYQSFTDWFMKSHPRRLEMGWTSVPMVQTRVDEISCCIGNSRGAGLYDVSPFILNRHLLRFVDSLYTSIYIWRL